MTAHMYSTFTTPGAKRINRARLSHLASLRLDLRGRTVLEVGAGIGELTRFWEDRGYTCLSTDAREDNLLEIRRRYPTRRVARLNLDDEDPTQLQETFDIIFCYGTLYHLSRPGFALANLSRVGRTILVETLVSGAAGANVELVEERSDNPNQAVGGVGCRPTRTWVLQELRRQWGHSYLTKTQPRHAEFPLDWTGPGLDQNRRAIFVGSRYPLKAASLTDSLVDHQTRQSAVEALARAAFRLPRSWSGDRTSTA